MKNKVFLVYRIYDNNGVFYVGRTSQTLKARMRQHMAVSNVAGDIPHINPNSVKKIEYAICASEADMCLYEVYYINLFHPSLNVDAKAEDCLTVTLPELKWLGYQFYREIEEWKVLYADAELGIKSTRQKMNHLDSLISEYDRKLNDGLITREEYFALVSQCKQIYGA